MGGARPGASAGPPFGRRLVQHPGIALLSKACERQREREVLARATTSPRRRPRRAAAPARANERRQAKRHCRQSSCCRPRAGRAPGTELGPPKPPLQTRGRHWHPHGIGPRGAAETRKRPSPHPLAWGRCSGMRMGTSGPAGRGLGCSVSFSPWGLGARQGRAQWVLGDTVVLRQPQGWHSRGDRCDGGDRCVAVCRVLTVILRVWRRVLNSLASS